MTDLEMTKLCAEAMGIHLTQPVTWRDAMGGLRAIPNQAITDVHLNDSGLNYDPLHDDAQAMALVKKCVLQIQPPWLRANMDWRVGHKDWTEADPHGADLNRAIVECVAKMQASK